MKSALELECAVRGGVVAAHWSVGGRGQSSVQLEKRDRREAGGKCEGYRKGSVRGGAMLTTRQKQRASQKGRTRAVSNKQRLPASRRQLEHGWQQLAAHSVPAALPGLAPLPLLRWCRRRRLGGYPPAGAVLARRAAAAAAPAAARTRVCRRSRLPGAAGPWIQVECAPLASGQDGGGCSLIRQPAAVPAGRAVGGVLPHEAAY